MRDEGLLWAVTPMSSILVVDDDFQVLEVVSEMLRLEGYDVDVADNGRLAMEKIRRRELISTVAGLLGD